MAFPFSRAQGDGEERGPGSDQRALGALQWCPPERGRQTEITRGTGTDVLQSKGPRKGETEERRQ